MRIEETSNGGYIKVPSPLENDLIRVMNRFFVNNAEEIENSREGIILETQKRVKPMVANMVKQIAWIQGQAIFEEQLSTILESEINKIMTKVTEEVLNMKMEILKTSSYVVDITAPTTVISMPAGVVLKHRKDILRVMVNGMKEIEDKGYRIITNMDNTIKDVKFNEPLDQGDIVELEYSKYSDMIRV